MADRRARLWWVATAALALLPLAACADEPCPPGSERADDGLCTLLPEDTGAAVEVVYSDCVADTGLMVDPAAIDATLTWDAWASGFFRTYCAACHASNTPDRRGAPEAVVFDAEADVLAHGERVRERVLNLGTMPVGGGVMAEDLVLLDRYLCRLGVEP